jgi:hypothetical protein
MVVDTTRRQLFIIYRCFGKIVDTTHRQLFIIYRCFGWLSIALVDNHLFIDANTTRNMSTYDLLIVTMNKNVIDLWRFYTRWSLAYWEAKSLINYDILIQKRHTFIR